MADVSDIKARLIEAAYIGAVAVCEPLISNPDGTQVQIDPLIKDIGLQQKDLLVYEVAKIHYAAILRAYHDKSGIWPDPQVASSGPVTPATPQTPQSLLAMVHASLKLFPPPRPPPPPPSLLP